MLGRQTALGSFLLIGSRLLARTLDLVTMLVLARVLQPVDFGLVAITMSIVVIVETILELPLNQALLRLSTISRAHYDTAFTLGLIRGILLSVILFSLAWPLAQIYEDGRIIWLTCFLALGPAARGLINPCFAQYQKNMNFWRDPIVELSGKFMGFCASIFVALLTTNYWAIAVGSVVFPIAMMVMSYVMLPYRPRLTVSELPIFLDFIGWISAAQFLRAINWQSERLLLGKLVTKTDLGLFSSANDLANILMLALLEPLQRPLLSALSNVHDQPKRLANAYQTSSSVIIAIGLPILVGESLLAEPAIRLVLGEKWLAAVPLLRWLPLSLIPSLFTLAAIPLFMAQSQTHAFFRRNLIEFCIKIPLLILGAIYFGMLGVIFARCVSEIAANIYSASVVQRLLNIPIMDQALIGSRSVLSVIIMVPVVMFCESKMHFVPDVITTLIDTLVLASIGASVYCTAAWILWRLAGRPAGLEAIIVGVLVLVVNKITPKL